MQQNKQGFGQLMLTQGLFFSWIVALIATLGSLYFSEIVGFIPCDLCWYQRILMYPLVIILTMAVIRKENNIAIYILPVSTLGMLTSLYHYSLQRGFLGDSATDGCSIIPCNTIYIEWLGFITIPFLAFIAFTLITISSALVWKYSKDEVSR